MGSVTSEAPSDRCGSYSPSADVSESETSSEFSARRFARGRGREGGGACGGSSPTRATRAVDAVAARMSDAELIVWDGNPEKRKTDCKEIDQMKVRFAKLLLGEDMSGGGNGVCSALAISNAITNLSATVFGELWRLEPLAPQKKAMWCREMDWLLCVSDSILEFIPSVQEFPGGGTFEVMVSRPRYDIDMNLPALKKLDTLLLGMLDTFQGTEFWYVDRGIAVADENEDGIGAYPPSPSLRQEKKWWLPCPRVPPTGLSEDARKKLQQCRDCTNQMLKLALEINNRVLAEMEIPDAYLQTLPKSGKSCLGEIIHRYITADQFSPECLPDCLDLSSEHHTLEIANRIEAAIHVWRRRDRKRHPPHHKGRKSWTGKVKDLVGDTGKTHLLAERAECLFQTLRLRYPCLPQTVLDMNKIQYNKDVGKSILESYSRVMESLAFNISARMDDLLYVDDSTKRSAAAELAPLFNRGFGGLPIQKRISPSPFSIHNTPCASPFATPSFCASTPVTASPGRSQHTLKNDSYHGKQNMNLVKHPPGDVERVRSYTGNLSAAKDACDAPERD